MERHQPASQLNPLGTALARWHTTGYRSAQGYHSTGTNTPAFRVHHIRAFSTVRQRSHAGIVAYALPGRRTLRADEPVVAEAYVFTLLTAATRIRGISACLSSGSRTEHGSNLTYCSRIQAAVCSLVHSFPHERLCQHGYLGQGINLPSCGVRLEFEASPPASEGCSWVSLETDPHTGLLSGNDITCTSKSKL